MYTIINKTGGIWGTCETREEAEQVCLVKGYSIKEDIKEAEIEVPKKKTVKKSK